MTMLWTLMKRRSAISKWIRRTLAGKQSASATRLVRATQLCYLCFNHTSSLELLLDERNGNPIDERDETIRKLKATIENMTEDAENTRKCMDIAVRAKNRAARAKEEADSCFQEVENRRRAAETGQVEAENRRINAEIRLMKAEATLRKREDDHAIEVERLSMAALDAKRDARLCSEEIKELVATICQLKEDLA
ncbi:hypothetical protein PM082_024914 [Marasmius tenuissimus]|nr:hypothetical protein PM082_024914 [Marasmius tenuissimus]